MMHARLLTPLVLLFASCSFTLGQDDQGKAKVDPSGTWKWERTFNENKIDYTLRLKWHDDKLTGTYQTVMENGPAGLGDPVEIDGGKVEGDKISFTVTRSFNDNEFTVAYVGKLSDDKVDGNVEVNFGNGAREFEWNAERIVRRADVIGKWSVKFETPNGAMESSFSMASDGDDLKGTYHSSVFGDNPIKKIELQDNKLSFVVTFQNNDQEFAVTYKAEPRGDKIAGVILTNFGGEERETPFEGARTAAPKDDDDKGDNDDDKDDDDKDEDDE